MRLEFHRRHHEAKMDTICFLIHFPGRICQYMLFQRTTGLSFSKCKTVPLHLMSDDNGNGNV